MRTSDSETQEAGESLDRFLHVTISVSDARGRKAPLTCRVNETQAPVSSTAPRCAHWVETVARQPLPQPSRLLGLPRLASSCGSHRCEWTEKEKPRARTPPRYRIAALCLDARHVTNWKFTPKDPGHWELPQMIWTESQTGQNQLGCADSGCTLTNGSAESSDVSVWESPTQAHRRSVAALWWPLLEVQLWAPGEAGWRPHGFLHPRAPAHLSEVLGVVLCGYKYHSLVLGPNNILQQVEEHSSLGVLAHKEEGGLRGEGWTWVPGHGWQTPPEEGAQRCLP